MKYLGFNKSNQLVKIAFSDEEKNILDNPEFLWIESNDLDIEKAVYEKYYVSFKENKVNFEPLNTYLYNQFGINIDPSSATYKQQIRLEPNPDKPLIYSVKNKEKFIDRINEVKNFINSNLNYMDNNILNTKWENYLNNLNIINYDNYTYPLIDETLPLLLINNKIVDKNFTLKNI